MSRLNIVLTVADDQRSTAMGCAGEPVATPGLDALGERGTRFTNAYHLGSCTGAICAPSRAMLHTGLPYDQLDHSLLGRRHPPRGHTLRLPPTLGQKLRGAGYHCFATGKWHNGVDLFHASFDAARHVFFDGMADHWFTPVEDYDPTGQYPAERRKRGDGHSSEVFGQTAIDFIHSRAGSDEPFFCYCAFTAPHDPRTPPDAYRRLYAPSETALPPNFVPEHPFDTGALRGRDERLLVHPRDPAEIRRALAAYYAMITHMDAWIARIHEAIAAIGALENTLIIHTGDHGLAVGQHGLLGKQNMYEHSVRTPLVMAGPGIPRGATAEGLCYQHDLHPTILEMAGVPEGEVGFESLTPQFSGGAGRSHVTCHYLDTHRMVRAGRHKLIEYRTPEADAPMRRQLFDVENDPYEMDDLIDTPAAPPRLANLEPHLPAWGFDIRNVQVA